MGKNNIKELNPEQQKAFNRLKKALQDCKRSGIIFVNNYGDLNAYNGKYVRGMVDSNSTCGENEIPLSGYGAYNSVTIANEWADDEGDHVLQLTAAGMKIISNEDHD